MSHFISFLAPPGDSISSYDCNAPSNSQPASVPPIFVDAMSVREEVFVHEQHCSLDNEVDSDDPRSFHWVVYASVDTGSKTSETPSWSHQVPLEDTGQTLPVGTIRLVPPPNAPYTQGSEHGMGHGKSTGKEQQEGYAISHGATNIHNEPYVKFGRLAVCKKFRGLGLAKLLLNTALAWAGEYNDEITSPAHFTKREVKRLHDIEVDDHSEWKGLVLIHAQNYLEGWYRRWGFKKDEGMGIWNEEGIEHIGMWKRIPLRS